MSAFIAATSPPYDPRVIDSWLNSADPAPIHRCAYFGDSELLKDHIAALIYRSFVERVKGCSVERLVMPLVIEVSADRLKAFRKLGLSVTTPPSAPVEVSQFVKVTRGDLDAEAGPYRLSPLQLARLKGHTSIVRILQESLPQRPRLEGKSLPSSIISVAHEDAAAWAARLFSTSHSAKPIRQFASSVDALLRERLGPALFDSHVAHVILDRRRYVLIADQHLNMAFRHTLEPLIHSIHDCRASKPIALFVESVVRDRECERGFYTPYLKGQKPSELLLGPEPKMFLISKWITESHDILHGRRKPDTKSLLFASMTNPAFREAWTVLKRGQLSSDIAAVIPALDESSRVALGNPALGYALLIKQPFCSQDELWVHLYLKLVEVSLNLGWIDKAYTSYVQAYLKDPKSARSVSQFIDKVNFELRDRLVSANIRSVVSSLPADVEVVVFMGWGHMKGLIQGLQG